MLDDRLPWWLDRAPRATLSGEGPPTSRLLYGESEAVTTTIELPDGASLFVADACSGITSVITLLPLGVFLAYFTERTWGRRLILIGAIVPLAMIGNLIRVVGTVIAAQEVGVEAATSGAVHESAGILTYVLGCAALLAVGWVMRLVAPPAARS